MRAGSEWYVTAGAPDPDGVDLVANATRLTAESAPYGIRRRSSRSATSRRDLITIVFPEAENEIVVDTYVHYLRRKLGRKVVATVRGRGYQLGRPCDR